MTFSTSLPVYVKFQLLILSEYAARMPSLSITLVLQTLISRLNLRLIWSRTLGDPPTL